MPLIGMTRMYVRNPLIPIKFGFRERPVLGDPRSTLRSATRGDGRTE
jgi:hypothetical protein